MQHEYLACGRSFLKLLDVQDGKARVAAVWEGQLHEYAERFPLPHLEAQGWHGIPDLPQHCKDLAK
jgi:hypothetical protein